MDECGEHATEDLGVFGLFNLARVSIYRVFLPFSFIPFVSFFLYYNHCLFVGYGEDEGPSS